jgi:hypothetical protein
MPEARFGLGKALKAVLAGALTLLEDGIYKLQGPKVCTSSHDSQSLLGSPSISLVCAVLKAGIRHYRVYTGQG